MDCICAGFVFIGGLALIITASVMKGIPLGATKMLPTWAACVVGGALMIPMCCGQVSLGLYGFMLGQEIQARTGRPPAMTEIMQEALIPSLIVDAITFLLALAIALGVGLTSVKPREPIDSGNVGYQPSNPGPDGSGGPGSWPAGS